LAVARARAMRQRVAARLKAATDPGDRETGSHLLEQLSAIEGVPEGAVSEASGVIALHAALASLRSEVEAGSRPTETQAARFRQIGALLQARIASLNALASGVFARFERGERAVPGVSGGEFGAAVVELDRKGIDFTGWVREYTAALRRYWVVPKAAMAGKGRVVVGFVVRKSGVVNAIDIVGPSGTLEFDRSASAAVYAARPAPPLPDAYPEPQCQVKVTFYFNETPPDVLPRK
jgi:TonB family protein